MDINAVRFCTELNNSVLDMQKTQSSDFKELFDKITGGDMDERYSLEEEIRKNYNVTLDVGSIVNYQQLSDNYNVSCMNYVVISPETLLQKWKMDYDRMDNTIAASYGDEPALYQITKSYCIQLDENGNVGDYMVVSGGMDTKSKDKPARTSTDEEMDKNTIGEGVIRKTVIRNQTFNMLQYGGAEVSLTEKELLAAMQVFVSGYKVPLKYSSLLYNQDFLPPEYRTENY